MAKIIKNSFGNFLVILLIFFLVMGWVFSGWPQIWQNPPIPPEVEEVRADTTTNSPSSNTGSGWTNPTNAYADGTNAATQTSSSGANIYSGYGFNLSGNNITQVRVRTDTWSTGIGGTTKSGNASANTNGTLPWTNPTDGYTSNNQYATVSPTYGTTVSQNPTANSNGTNPWTNPANGYTSNNSYAITTAFSAGSDTRRPTSDTQDTANSTKSTGNYFYALVDETTAGDTDYYTMTNNSGGHNVMGFSAFAVGSNCGITNLTVYYRAGNAVSNAANIRASLLVGTTYYDSTDAGVDPVDSPNFSTYSYAFTVNPATGLAWTYDEINGTDSNTAHRLNGFGTASSDLNPDVKVSWLYATVNYYTVVSYDQIYGTFGLSDPISGSTITKVEIGYEAFTSAATGQLDLYTSENGGSGWNPIHTTANLVTSDPGTYTYVDVTSDDSSWTWTELDNTNFKVKVVSHWISDNITWSLDALVVRITYDDRRGYDQIYGTFDITGTTETISTVEVGYEAFAAATGKLDIYTSSNGGSSWSSAHTTANLGTSDPNTYTYVDVTSDYAWTWTLLNNSNLKVKVVSNYVSGTPTWSLDALVVRVTYTTLTDDQIRIAVSWDGGSSWSSNYDTNLSGSETTYWTDVTAATTWTPTKLNDSNFQVSVNSVTVGDTSTINLDWIPVEVTYTIIPITCTTPLDGLTNSFGTIDNMAIYAATTSSTTVSSNSTVYIKIYDSGSGSNPGLYKNPDLIESPTAANPSNATDTMQIGAEGYGIMATTTGSNLVIATRYDNASSTNIVGGLKVGSGNAEVVASSSAAVTDEVVYIDYETAVSVSTPPGTYQDSITIICSSD